MGKLKYIFIIIALAGVYFAKTRIDEQNKAKVEMIESFDEDQPAQNVPAVKK